AEDVEDMHERSSEATRYQRYFAPMNDWRVDQLSRISGGHRGATLVAQDASGQVIGLGNLFPEHPDDTSAAEIAVIVEDAWQGLGLGTLLLAHLIELARRQRFTTLTALVLATNTGMIRLLERLDLTWSKQTDPDLGPGVVRLSADLGERA
ncbi:MAG: GNAT family N-acetyltransferase, partial [Candidatus Nanopelagicales bacterium]